MFSIIEVIPRLKLVAKGYFAGATDHSAFHFQVRDLTEHLSRGQITSLITKLLIELEK